MIKSMILFCPGPSMPLDRYPQLRQFSDIGAINHAREAVLKNHSTAHPDYWFFSDNPEEFPQTNYDTPSTVVCRATYEKKVRALGASSVCPVKSRRTGDAESNPYTSKFFYSGPYTLLFATLWSIRQGYKQIVFVGTDMSDRKISFEKISLQLILWHKDHNQKHGIEFISLQESRINSICNVMTIQEYIDKGKDP